MGDVVSLCKAVWHERRLRVPRTMIFGRGLGTTTYQEKVIGMVDLGDRVVAHVG